MHTPQLAIAALVLLGAFFATGAAQQSREQRVRFVVQVPTKHYGSDLYLACNANNWNPADDRWKLRPGPEDQPGRYTIEIPVSIFPGGTLEYKFTKGSWDTVELNADRRDITNRSLSTGDVRHGETLREISISIPAFGDERGDQARESTVVGTLEIFDFTSKTLDNSRKIRVWLPEQYAKHPEQQFPVLYMHDGQNCFDNATSSFGWEWRIDETMTELIASGSVPPMIVVGIDNAGANRSWEYNASYATFGDRAPYGEKYVAMLVEELMPEIASRYRVKAGPEHTALGGSSFGGNITMLAAMERPGVFGQLLIESPAVPIVGPKYLEAILAFAESNRWTPKNERFTGRVFVAMGTKETQNEPYNQRLVKLMDELAPAFANEDHRIVVEEGAVHNENAWAARFPEAAKFLFGHR